MCRAHTGEGATDGKPYPFDCDLPFACPTGYSPAGQLLHHAGTRFAMTMAANMFGRQRCRLMFCRRSVNGTYRLEAVMPKVDAPGWAAIAGRWLPGGSEPPAIAGDAAAWARPMPGNLPHKRGRDFVDFDEDIQVKDLSERLSLMGTTTSSC